MKTACPACGATFSLDVLLGNEGAREAVMTALAIPAPLGKLLVQYLGLFRPAQRQLSFDRVASLLGELLPMIAEAKIEREGRIWSAPQDYWVMALGEMIAKRDSLTLPLKSHGYLLAIIAGYGMKAEGKTEAQGEAHKAGRTPSSTPAAYQRNTAVLGVECSGTTPGAVVPAQSKSQMPAAVRAAINPVGAIHESPAKTKGGNHDA